MRVAENVPPPASVASAVTACVPRSAKRAFHVPVKTSETPVRSIATCLPSTRKRTERTRLVEPATATSATVFSTHAFCGGDTQLTAGPETPVIDTERNAVFGRMLLPTPLTFFASWKSAADSTARVRPARSLWAALGIGKIATPEPGSYSAAPTSTPRYAITSESGSTPAPASVTRATIVGRPCATRFVTSRIFGGRTSLTHDRRTYCPGSERPVKGSEPESTVT